MYFASGSRPQVEKQTTLIVTEGKTDWKHLKAALAKLKAQNEMGELDIEFLEYESETEMGDTQLLKICEALFRFPQERKLIFVFDRDNPKIISEVVSENNFKNWGNNVYSMAIPIPEHRTDEEGVCIEMYYQDSEITRKDQAAEHAP